MYFVVYIVCVVFTLTLEYITIGDTMSRKALLTLTALLCCVHVLLCLGTSWRRRGFQLLTSRKIGKVYRIRVVVTLFVAKSFLLCIYVHTYFILLHYIINNNHLYVFHLFEFRCYFNTVLVSYLY